MADDVADDSSIPAMDGSTLLPLSPHAPPTLPPRSLLACRSGVVVGPSYQTPPGANPARGGGDGGGGGCGGGGGAAASSKKGGMSGKNYSYPYP